MKVNFQVREETNLPCPLLYSGRFLLQCLSSVSLANAGRVEVQLSSWHFIQLLLRKYGPYCHSAPVSVSIVRHSLQLFVFRVLRLFSSSFSIPSLELHRERNVSCKWRFQVHLFKFQKKGSLTSAAEQDRKMVFSY